MNGEPVPAASPPAEAANTSASLPGTSSTEGETDSGIGGRSAAATRLASPPAMAQRTILCYLESDGSLALEAIERLRTVAPSEVLPMPTVAQVLETVEHTPGSAGLLPIEDSYDGESLAVYDRLVFESWNAYIRDEVVVSDSLDAFAQSAGAAASVHTAVATPRGVEQCFRFVQEHGLRSRYVESAAEACRIVSTSSDDGLIALAPIRMAERFGLVTVAAGIEDLPDLKTRFIVVSREVAPPTGDDKTTLIVTPAVDRSGTLVDLLGAFGENDVNMVSLISRPLRASVGTHCFQITCEGHVSDPPLQATIRRLWEKGARIKVLGSYPAWTGDQVMTPFDALPAASVGPDDDADEQVRLLAPPAG
jgi:prephenate dehydratase